MASAGVIVLPAAQGGIRVYLIKSSTLYLQMIAQLGLSKYQYIFKGIEGAVLLGGNLADTDDITLAMENVVVNRGMEPTVHLDIVTTTSTCNCKFCAVPVH